MADWSSQDKRDKAPKSVWCGPHSTFPISDAEDVKNAASLIGKADDPAAVKACIIRKAKANGWALPKSWQDKATNSAGDVWYDDDEVVEVQGYPVTFSAKAKMEMSHGELHQRLQSALDGEANGQSSGSYIRDVWPDHIVYHNYGSGSGDSGTTYIRKYSVDSESGEPALDDEKQEVVGHMEYKPVKRVTSMSFSDTATFSADGDVVERTGIIFKVGQYPEKGLAEFTVADADAAVAGFTEVPLELEHFDTYGQPSILTGRLGSLTSLWRDGDYLKGKLRVPKWIDGIWGESGRKVSAVIDIPSKRIDRTGIVLAPHVGEAAVMSAFASFSGARHSESDRAVMQVAHDALMQTGAVDCDENNTVSAKAKRPKAANSKGETTMSNENTVDKAAFDRQATELAAVQQELRVARAERAVAAMSRGLQVDDKLFALATATLAAAMASPKATFAANEQNYDLEGGVSAILKALFAELPKEDRFSDPLAAGFNFLPGATKGNQNGGYDEKAVLAQLQAEERSSYNNNGNN